MVYQHILQDGQFLETCTQDQHCILRSECNRNHAQCPPHSSFQKSLLALLKVFSLVLTCLNFLFSTNKHFDLEEGHKERDFYSRCFLIGYYLFLIRIFLIIDMNHVMISTFLTFSSSFFNTTRKSGHSRATKDRGQYIKDGRGMVCDQIVFCVFFLSDCM